MRRAHRLDGNHAALTAEFERLGCSVLSLAGLGRGAPDALIGLAGLCMCVEFKDGSKPPSQRSMTPDEVRFRQGWKGGYRIVSNPAEVAETVEVLKLWHAAIRRHMSDAMRYELEGRN